MTTSVGRLRLDPTFENGVKLVLLSHNTKMGAAKGAILLAELCVARGSLSHAAVEGQPERGRVGPPNAALHARRRLGLIGEDRRDDVSGSARLVGQWPRPHRARSVVVAQAVTARLRSSPTSVLRFSTREGFMAAPSDW